MEDHAWPWFNREQVYYRERGFDQNAGHLGTALASVRDAMRSSTDSNIHTDGRTASYHHPEKQMVNVIEHMEQLRVSSALAWIAQT